MTDPYAQLVAAGQRKVAAAAPAPLAADAPSPAHAAVLDALDQLLGLVTANAGGLPPMARAMLSAVSSSRGMLLDGITRMPEAQLLGILRTLGGRIAAVPGVLDQ